VASYTELLKTQGVARIIAAQLTARFPSGMLSLAFLLHVEQQTGSYGAAGLVLAATSIGQAVAGPLTSRLMGRLGMRPVLISTLVVCVASVIAIGVLPPCLVLLMLAQGELWRLFTSMFLHSLGLLVHIIFNMYALYLFGPPLEREVGSAPLAALNQARGLAGGALFYLLVPGGQAVGASGAIFGLFGAWLVASYRNRHTFQGRANLQDAFARVWHGEVENDGFNGLVLRARLNWRDVTVLRAIARYLRQAGTTFSDRYVEQALATNAPVARLLMHLFRARFEPGHAEAVEGVLQGAMAELLGGEEAPLSGRQ
jgi:MFS family permease